MRHIIFILSISLLLFSCGQSDTKQKELELKERELALKEKELELKQKDSSGIKSQTIDTAKILTSKDASSQDEIPMDGSAVTEFTKEMLLSESELLDLKNGDGKYHNDKVGIIQQVTKEVKNEINTISIKNIGVINVSVPSEGKKMNKESLEWFNKIVKTGAKIKYSYYCTGNEFKGTDCEYLKLTYLKLLPK